MRRDAILAGAGGLALLPALLLVTAGLAGLDGSVPSVLSAPVLVMGGLFVALLTSLLATLRWSVHRGEDGIRITCTILNRKANLAVLLIGLGLLATITGYLFVENFAPRGECP